LDRRLHGVRGFLFFFFFFFFPLISVITSGSNRNMGIGVLSFFVSFIPVHGHTEFLVFDYLAMIPSRLNFSFIIWLGYLINNIRLDWAWVGVFFWFGYMAHLSTFNC